MELELKKLSLEGFKDTGECLGDCDIYEKYEDINEEAHRRVAYYDNSLNKVVSRFDMRDG